MKKKIMYGISAKEYEDYLTKKMQENGIEPIIVKAVTYREAILEYLPGSGAEVLIFRDSLNGSVDLGKILEQVRVDYPELQVIFICATTASDPILAKCVTLGIYDIINSNSVNAQEIVRHVLHPANFHDVYQYYRFSNADVPANSQKQNQAEQRARLGILEKLFKTKPQEPEPKEEPAPGKSNLALPAAQRESKVDQGLMREAIYESAVRDAQANMDDLIQKAVQKETAALREAKAEVEKELSDTKLLMAQRESRTVDLMNQLDAEKAANEELSQENTRLMEESARNITLYEEQISALRSDRDTPTWYAAQEQSWQEQKEGMSQKIHELMDKCATLTAEKAKLELDMEQATAQKPLDSHSISEDKLRQEADRLRNELGSSAHELRAMRSELRKVKANLEESKKERARLEEIVGSEEFARRDFSYPALCVPETDGSRNTTDNGPSHVIAVLGAKHGVGTTTVAMNLAASFAKQGHKTLLVELNDRFPLTNEYFELTNVPSGLNTAIIALREGETQAVDGTIIRFRALRPRFSGVAKAYKRLPAGFHLLTYSNEDLIDAMHGEHEHMTPEVMASLIRYLIRKQMYARVVIDIQPDDNETITAISQNAALVDKLLIVMGQDTHSIGSAGVLISNLCKSDGQRLAAGAELVMTRFNQSVGINTPQVSKMLNVQESRFSVLSEDTIGYLEAMASGVPYVINNGVFSGEYELLRGKAEL